MRKLKRSGLVIYSAGFLLILLSCAKEPTEVERTPTSTFPLTTDSRWEYDGLWYQVPLVDSVSADTIEKEMYRHIIGPDSLPGIPNLVICDDTVISNLTAGVDTFVNRQWMKIEDNQLKVFAADQFEVGEEPDPYIYDNPHILLDLPLNYAKEWICWESDTPGIRREERRVAGLDYIEIPGGWQYCDVILCNEIDSSEGGTDYSMYEWYTDDGLMRLEADFGTDIFETLRTLQYWELIDYDIKP